MNDHLTATRDHHGALPTTRWSIVRAMAGTSTERREALETFATDYWQAVYAFARKKGHSPEDAEDLTQDFLADLLARESFAQLSIDKGRFRSWLLACLHNYLRADWRDRKRQKRGGGIRHVSIDRDVGEAWLDGADVDTLSPDLIFDRRWASAVLDRALTELARSYDRDGKKQIADVLVPMIAAPDDRQSYADAARDLGISEPSARMAAFRMRKRLRGLVREEIATTVASPDEVEDELRDLFSSFGRSAEH